MHRPDEFLMRVIGEGLPWLVPPFPLAASIGLDGLLLAILGSRGWATNGGDRGLFFVIRGRWVVVTDPGCCDSPLRLEPFITWVLTNMIQSSLIATEGRGRERTHWPPVLWGKAPTSGQKAPTVCSHQDSPSGALSLFSGSLSEFGRKGAACSFRAAYGFSSGGLLIMSRTNLMAPGWGRKLGNQSSLMQRILNLLSASANQCAGVSEQEAGILAEYTVRWRPSIFSCIQQMAQFLFCM